MKTASKEKHLKSKNLNWARELIRLVYSFPKRKSWNTPSGTIIRASGQRNSQYFTDAAHGEANSCVVNIIFR